MTKLLIFGILLFFTLNVTIAQSTFSEKATQTAIQQICDAFESHRIVALAEAHKLQEEHDFILRLIKDSCFTKKVNSIVIEFANALYQKTIDDYISGKNISLTEVRKAFRNTGFSPFSPWDAPVYERFFVEVRVLNQTLPESKKIRIIAGDQPVDWTKSKSEIEKIKELYPRDKYLASIVINEILIKNKKTLIIAGGNHLYRHSWNPYANSQTDVAIDIIERSYPKSCFIIFIHAFETRNSQLERNLSNNDTPSFINLKNSWLGKISSDSILQQSVTRGFPDGKTVSVKINIYPGMTLEDLADAYIYFGDILFLTASQPDNNMYRIDTSYTKELARRYKMVSGKEFPFEEFLNEKRSLRYYTPADHSSPPPPPPK